MANKSKTAQTWFPNLEHDLNLEYFPFSSNKKNYTNPIGEGIIPFISCFQPEKIMKRKIEIYVIYIIIDFVGTIEIHKKIAQITALKESNRFLVQGTALDLQKFHG